MFWLFMIIAGGAATFATLGMYAVWFKILNIALLAAVVVIIGLSGVLLSRHLFSKK